MTRWGNYNYNRLAPNLSLPRNWQSLRSATTTPAVAFFGRARRRSCISNGRLFRFCPGAFCRAVPAAAMPDCAVQPLWGEVLGHWQRFHGSAIAASVS